MCKEILNHLSNEHLNISSLLYILERQLQSIKDGDKPDYFLMHDITCYLTYYSDHYHHPFEDMIYTRLAEKQREFSPVVERVEKQHRQIALKGNGLRELINGIIRGSIFSRENIFNDGIDYINSYRAHMQTEEDELFGPLSEHLIAADWMVLISIFQWRPDPVYSDEVSREYQHLKDSIKDGGAGDWPWKESLVNSCPVCSSMESF